jgi:cytochrome c-type biogenesis protein CcmH
MKKLLLALLLATSLFAQPNLNVPDAAQFVGQPQGAPIAGEELFRRTNRVSGLLRCPVCQGLSVADSPSEMAVNMKAQVKELLGRGYTEKQILQYFELSYGQFVLLEPKFEGMSSLVWVIPIAALLLGVAVVFFKLKKLEAPLPTDNRQPTTDNDPYLDRVRDLVAGDKR